MPASLTAHRPTTDLLPLAQTISARSASGAAGRVRVLGRSAPLADALSRLARLAEADLPLVIVGESGVGKGLFARAAHALSQRSEGPFVRFDVAQYADDAHLLADLVGVASGEAGAFERADGGTLLLDDVEALPRRAQAALLRALDRRETTRLGATVPTPIDVRVIATARGDLRTLAARGGFHEPLLNRLQRLSLCVPPLRERGDDWRRIAEAHLLALGERHGERRRFAPAALDVLATADWPGNAHEVHAVVETAYWSARGPAIERADLRVARPARAADRASGGTLRAVAVGPAPSRAGVVGDALARMSAGKGSFWNVVRDPYLDRELNRSEVRQIVRRALERSAGSYKRALETFGLGADEYLRFMDFLRHHRLKPMRGAA